MSTWRTLPSGRPIRHNDAHQPTGSYACRVSCFAGGIRHGSEPCGGHPAGYSVGWTWPARQALMSSHSNSSETRKVVTVVFSDVTGSTALGEQLDPESLRRLMARYFQEMEAAVARHGGSVEKFIGDAVVAMFGVPKLHEDDALRAVRAAVDMRHALNQLNDEFDRLWGVRILVRIGVNTGEVVAGDPTRSEPFIVSDMVNVAARLQQAAEPGQILIGESTYRLVRDAVTADPLPSRTVKGKKAPVSSWNLLDVAPGVPGWGRRLDSPLVGRDRELRALKEAFRRAATSRSCEVVTVLGAAGVGKSRLAKEFLTRLGSGPRVVSGHCLPYGEGITFWPVVEVLREAAGVGQADLPEEARRKILELLDPAATTQLIGERVAALLGLSGVTPGIQETFWAVRKVFERLAAQRALVVVFDDIQWGEPTFLDLLEYLADWIQDVPLMLLCLARHDLFDVRGVWMTGKPNASLINLHPLTTSQTEGLIDNLLAGARVPEGALGQLAEVADGNPLFAEEMLRMLVDDGRLVRNNGSWTVAGDISTLAIPPTIHALITARLDRLDQEERAVIERASVVGRQFSWGAIAELFPPGKREGLGSDLQSLTRKELIRPDRSDLSDEDTFRFAHILIRDAAYHGIPKATRADLHERFAEWVVKQFRDRAGEYEEIAGYHLEQAYRTLAELGPVDQRIQALGHRAATPLASAGQRAFARGDMPAAANLLSRATSLLPIGDSMLPQALPDLAFALLETGDFATLQDVLANLKQAATISLDPAAEAHALILDLWIRLFTHPEGWAGEANRQATLAISMFESRRDDRGLDRGWALLGLSHMMKAQFGNALDAWEKAAAHAAAAGIERQELEDLSWVPLCVWGGPTPVDEGVGRCQEILDRAAGDRKAMSTALFTQGKLEAMRGRFDEARELIARARSILQEVALTVWLAGPLTQMAGWVEILAGDFASAERDLRRGAKTLQEIGELSWLSTVASILAEAVYGQGRYDEVDEFLQISAETAGSEDIYSQSLARSVRAKLLARQGDVEAAEELGRQAVAIVKPTDFLFMQAIALLNLGETLQLARRANEAQGALHDAIRVCEQKGFVVGAGRAREMLDKA
jgi:class 3 adenylate cyclase/tetratricopeptide (TPR) repeat protein